MPALAQVRSRTASEPKVLLHVKDLETHFYGEDGVTRALGGVSFEVREGETLGIVGESGCGKSVTSLSILRLLPRLTGKTVGGQILFEGKDLLKVSDKEMRQIRGGAISMIFQEPMTSLNPVQTVGAQISEALIIHARMGKRAALAKAEDMLKLVRIADPKRRLASYPHELSGGMRQRVMIAMALACSPKLLIADEPTTALDVTMQAQILRLIVDLKRSMDAAVIMITHDLGVVAETCQRVIVMYAGRIVEEADVNDLFEQPAHPYTKGLLKSVPDRQSRRRERLPEITGVVPSLRDPVVGCSFAPRCPMAIAICSEKSPPRAKVGASHWASCWRTEEVVAQ